MHGTRKTCVRNAFFFRSPQRARRTRTHARRMAPSQWLGPTPGRRETERARAPANARSSSGSGGSLVVFLSMQEPLRGRRRLPFSPRSASPLLSFSVAPSPSPAFPRPFPPSSPLFSRTLFPCGRGFPFFSSERERRGSRGPRFARGLAQRGARHGAGGGWRAAGRPKNVARRRTRCARCRAAL